MPDLSGFAAFADRVGRVSPACSTCSTVSPEQVLQKNSNKNRDVSRVAPVAPRFDDEGMVRDLLDRYEERAAILEYDAGLSRSEAEALARREVYGSQADAA